MNLMSSADVSAAGKEPRTPSRRMSYVVLASLMLLGIVAGSTIVALTSLVTKAHAATAAGSYSWSRAKIGGGGFITGLIADPTQPGVIYGRGDVEGCFRWDPTTQTWTQMMDSLFDNGGADPATTLGGCLGLAVDPNPPAGQHVLYAAFGSNTNWFWGFNQSQGLYKSTDGGATWTDVFTTQVSGNAGFRTTGEPLQVDPNNSNVIYYGSESYQVNNGVDTTDLGGLFRSTQAGVSGSWKQVTSVPIAKLSSASDVEAGARNVLIDSRQGTVSGSGIGVTGQVSKVVYVFNHGSDTTTTGMYWSTDGGATFSKMAFTNTPTNVNRLDLGTGNAIYASTPSGIYQFDGVGTWTVVDGTSGTGFDAFATDPANRKQMVAFDSNAFWPLWVTSDATASTVTWSKQQYAYEASAYNTSPTWNSWSILDPSSVLFDTTSSSNGSTPRLFEADAYGVRVTPNIYAPAPSVAWTSLVSGLETTVVRQMVSPEAPSRTILHTGTADVWGFRINDLSQWATQNPPSSQVGGSRDMSGIAVGGANWQNLPNWNSSPTDVILGTTGDIFTSTNDGVTLTQANLPAAPWSPGLPWSIGSDEMAISSGNRDNAVYVPPGLKHFYYTNNAFSGGSSITWNTSSDLPDIVQQNADLYDSDRLLTTDKGITGKFYYSDIASSGGKIEIYASTDGGKTWAIPSGNQSTVLPGNPNGNNQTFVIAPPGTSNEVWYGSSEGLYRSTDGGANFTKLSTVAYSHSYSFGAPAPGTTTPTLFVAGKVTVGGQTVQGIFRSDDTGQSFVQINDASHQYPDIRMVEGDKQVFGRVFISNAAGVVVGTLTSSTAKSGDTALDRTGWTATASTSDGNKPASNVLDGDITTRWGSGTAQSNGQYFQIDMGAPKVIDEIALDNTGSPEDAPRGYQVYVSNDGTNWGNAVASGAGSTHQSITKIFFSALVSARYIKIVQTGSDPVYWWSMSEFNAYGPASLGASSGTGSLLNRSGWTASASKSYLPDYPASNALDGNAGTRWGSGVAQSNGLSFQVDMGAIQSFSKITLDNTGSAGDYPRGYSVSVSNDGTTWSSAIATGTGSGNVTTITFASQLARYIKVTETGSDPSSWWSIYEFNVYN